MKLHAALVLNMTYWVIYEPRKDTSGAPNEKLLAKYLKYHFLLS